MPRLQALRFAVFFVLLTVNCFCLPQAEDLRPAAVRIGNITSGSWGNGFIFKIDDDRSAVYILTAAHVTGDHEAVKVIFSTTASKSAKGVVIRRDKERDLSVVKVVGQNNIPADVMLMGFAEPSILRPGDFVRSVAYSAANDGWSVQSATVELMRDEPLTLGSVSVPVLRLSGTIREGDSGSPLLLNDEVVGVIEAGPATGTSSSIAVQVSTIRDFLGELFPKRIFLQPYKRSDAEQPPDPAAAQSATHFLDLLINNRLLDAYKQLASATASNLSEAGFVTTYTPFTTGAMSGLLDRKLASSQRMGAVPGMPQITGDIYVLSFESKYKGYPGIRVFESVTVLKEHDSWNIVNFIWNSQSPENGR